MHFVFCICELAWWQTSHIWSFQNCLKWSRIQYDYLTEFPECSCSSIKCSRRISNSNNQHARTCMRATAIMNDTHKYVWRRRAAAAAHVMNFLLFHFFSVVFLRCVRQIGIIVCLPRVQNEKQFSWIEAHIRVRKGTHIVHDRPSDMILSASNKHDTISNEMRLACVCVFCRCRAVGCCATLRAAFLWPSIVRCALPTHTERGILWCACERRVHTNLYGLHAGQKQLVNV